MCIDATKRASNVNQIHILQLSLLKPQALRKLKPCVHHHESRKIKRQTINFNPGFVSDVLWYKGSTPGTPVPTFWKQFGKDKLPNHDDSLCMQRETVMTSLKPSRHSVFTGITSETDLFVHLRRNQSQRASIFSQNALLQMQCKHKVSFIKNHGFMLCGEGATLMLQQENTDI